MTITDSFTHEDIQGFRFGKGIIGRPGMVSHIYYIDGLLIDTGHSRVRREVMAAVGSLRVKQLFITHHHEDHTGNLHILQPHYDRPAYASPLCCEIMKDPPSLSLAQKVTWGNRPPSHNLIPKVDYIETDHYRFQLIPIPGHAPDMVALYEPEKHWLFSSDLFINTHIGFFLRGESMLQQINSMKKVLELDFNVMLCGHNPQLKDPKKKLRKKLDYFERFYAEVQEGYAKGLPARQIFRKMKLNEYSYVRLLSKGRLSRLNMVKAAMEDISAAIP
ncbi:MBL fold metallo-hydrolase [Roseivirga sp. BDSF3-8]|uniref:MBL fold metallo-hydrolase n=1 Tax=Roseivirga sp. BDSF3-8 TaxID=3241598 RepID=UPI003531E436